jgi:hypothetical protein
MFDFARTERAGYIVLYPETEEAEAWADAHDEPANLSGGIVADAELIQAIRDAGLTIQDDFPG